MRLSPVVQIPRLQLHICGYPVTHLQLHNTFTSTSFTVIFSVRWYFPRYLVHSHVVLSPFPSLRYFRYFSFSLLESVSQVNHDYPWWDEPTVIWCHYWHVIYTYVEPLLAPHLMVCGAFTGISFTEMWNFYWHLV